MEDEYARNPLFMQTFQVAPSYSWEGFNFSLSISASTEYTDSDSATYENQILFSDLMLSVSKSLVDLSKYDMGLTGSLKFGLPTSLVSQMATLYLSATASVSLSKTFFKHLTVSYSLSGKKNFHEYQSPVIKEDDLRDFETYARGGGDELLEKSLTATGRNNVSFSITNSLALSYSFTDTLSLSLSYAYSVGFIYKTFEKDEYTSEYADTGRAYRDLTIGGIDVSYKINGMFSVSGGVTTAQLPKTADNESFRFPFYNFSELADNMSTFYIDLIVNF